MEENQIGLFIRDRRLELGLTQQQLADKLGVTDKAVSKWERCVSYPDITLLRELAEALSVSVAELLDGKREMELVSQTPPVAERVVLDTADCTAPAGKKKRSWRFWIFAVLTAGCFISALVLGIVYCAVGFDVKPDVLLAIKCVGFGWAVCCPLLGWDRYPVAGSLAVLSCAIVPFLMQFGPLPFWAYWIALLSVGYLWAVYFLCKWLLRRRMWLAAGWTLLLGGLLALGINQIVWSFTGIDADIVSVRLNLLTAVLCGGSCFFIDFLLRRRRAEG